MRAHYATRLYRVDCEYGMRHETWYCVGNHMIDNDWLFDRHGLYVTIVERIEPTRTLIAFANDWASNVGPA